MIKFTTKLITISDLKVFTQEANRATGKAMVIRGDYKIPATSIMTLISLNPSAEFTVELENIADIDLFSCQKFDVTQINENRTAVIELDNVISQYKDCIDPDDYIKVVKAIGYLKANI